MQVKQLQLPQLPQPRKKTGKCWLAVFGKVNSSYDPDDNDDSEEVVENYSLCYSHKPSEDELIDSMDNDTDWEILSLMEITI